jgi:hypothetical protein
MSYYRNQANLRMLNKIQLKREEKKKAINDNSGNWEHRIYKCIPEAKILSDLVSPNCLNPKNVNTIRFPPKTKEMEILEKKKLSSGDKIILQNCTNLKNTAIRKDIEEVRMLGLASKPNTIEGRKYLLLWSLEQQLEKKNIEAIISIYLRLNEPEFHSTSKDSEYHKEFATQIQRMNAVAKEADLICMQFTVFHTQMPPLNKKGFNKFDKWQEDVIDNIDRNISTIVNAPTSAGKSVLSSYTTTKGDSLFVVPTDALAWQMASYITHVTGKVVPILTKTHQSCPTRKEMIELIKSSASIVGTPECIVDFLPTIGNKSFKWLVFDEIHMIGKPEGAAMEQIIKVIPDTPILALSATIGNTDELVTWFSTVVPSQQFNKVVCDKRFFNLQRYYYDKSNTLVSLHPLSLIEESDIMNGSILTKNLQPSPPHAWDLAMKIGIEKLGELNPYTYFSVDKRIELDDATEYFNKLIVFITNYYKTDRDFVMTIIDSYKHEHIESSDVNLVDMAIKLKESNMTPAIMFQTDTISCLEMVYEFAKDIENREDTKYPHLIKDRLKLAKKARRLEKNKDETRKIDDDKNTKKALKEMMGTTKLKKDGYGVSSVAKQHEEVIVVPNLQEPHSDFILNPVQYFSETTVEDWVVDLKKYFPNTGDYYHWIVKLLWRGIGVYAKGLPDPYLRLVQTLTNMKQLAIVFSDLSLVFGVSMPFRTSVTISDSKLDTMLFHQMSGRAGRRGLDKEGNVVFAGYSWNRIKELSISTIPTVVGTNNVIYTIPHGNKLSAHYNTNMNWENANMNFLDTSITNEDSKEFLEGIKSNYIDGGWSFALNDDVNHLHMNWMFRSCEDSVLVSFIIPYLRRAFEGKDHTKEINQINMAHFLGRFISVVEAEDDSNILEDPAILNESPYDTIISTLEELQIDVPSRVDNKVYLSIQQNGLVPQSSLQKTDDLRQRLVKFGDMLRHIQHYCFHSNIVCLTKIMGKLLTRIWWIYHTSSPLMKSFKTYQEISDDETDEIEV